MNAPTVITPDTAALTKDSSNALDAAKAFRVVSAADYEEAGLRLKLIKGLMANVDAHFGPHIARAYTAHKALVADRNLTMAPLTQAETVYKNHLLTYQREQERLRQEQERKARAIADAEAGRIREQAARAEATARAKAEELRRQQEEAERAGRAAEAAKLAAKAAQVEERGAEKAAALEERAEMIPTPVIEVQTPKVSGIATKEVWSFEITDASLVPDSYKTIDERKIGAVVRAMKSASNIPGVRVFTVQSIAARSSS